jgi:DNA-binding transcriptional ArsR family regulator
MPSSPLPDDPVAPVLEALGDATRRGVLVALANEGAATATQLATAFPVTRQAVAKHLQVLLDAGLVAAERRGRETVFAFVPGSLAGLAAWIDDLDGTDAGATWDDNVAALQRHLAEQAARRGLRPASGPLRAAAARRPPPPIS